MNSLSLIIKFKKVPLLYKIAPWWSNGILFLPEIKYIYIYCTFYSVVHTAVMVIGQQVLIYIL